MGRGARRALPERRPGARGRRDRLLLPHAPLRGGEARGTFYQGDLDILDGAGGISLEVHGDQRDWSKLDLGVRVTLVRRLDLTLEYAFHDVGASRPIKHDEALATLRLVF